MVSVDLRLDIDTSTVEIAGRWFPACVLVCPPDDGKANDDWDRTLGTPWVYIPLESGALVCCQPTERSGLECSLVARSCRLSVSPADSCWLPHQLRLDGRRLVPGWQWWTGCEPAWLVEHIDRVSTFAYSQPPGPLVELRRLADEPKQPAEQGATS